MSQTVISIKGDGKGLYESCIGEYEGDTRLRHEDYILNREDLHKLKQQVDRVWFTYVEEVVDA